MAAVDHGRGKDGRGKIGSGGYICIFFFFKAKQEWVKEEER